MDVRKQLLLGIVIINIIVWGFASLTPSNNSAKVKSVKVQPYSESSNVVERVIGGKTITLPSPEGWYEVSKDRPSALKALRPLVLSPNRLVAAFLPGKVSEIPEYGKYALIMVSKDIEQMPDLPSSEFRWLRAQVEKKNGNFVENLDEKYGREFALSSSAVINIGDIKPLGVFMSKPKAIAYASLMSTTTNIEGNEYKHNVFIGLATLLIKGKMFNVQITSEYKTDADISRAVKDTRSFVNSIIKAN